VENAVFWWGLLKLWHAAVRCEHLSLFLGGKYWRNERFCGCGSVLSLVGLERIQRWGKGVGLYLKYNVSYWLKIVKSWKILYHISYVAGGKGRDWWAGMLGIICAMNLNESDQMKLHGPGDEAGVLHCNHCIICTVRKMTVWCTKNLVSCAVFCCVCWGLGWMVEVHLCQITSGWERLGKDSLSFHGAG
jgi:hypothetical protein